MRSVASYAVRFQMAPEEVWDTPYEMLAAMSVERQRMHGKAWNRPLDEDESAKKADALAWHKQRLAKARAA